MLAIVKRTLAAMSCAMLLGSPGVAQPSLPVPRGDVVLTVSGAVGATNGDGVARFDRAMLEALPAVTITTSTIWTEGTPEFTGVPLSALLDALGVTEGVLAMTAINDYAVDVPVSDAVETGPIVAYRMNGAPMTVRSKGPLWLVYPYDSNPEYRTEVIYSRSVWQLDRIVVRR